MNRIHLVMIFICLLSGCASAQKKGSSDDSKSETPKLLKPNVKKIWIPPELKNGGLEWEEGHYLYQIERGTVWSR